MLDDMLYSSVLTLMAGGALSTALAVASGRIPDRSPQPLAGHSVDASPPLVATPRVAAIGQRQAGDGRQMAATP